MKRFLSALILFALTVSLFAQLEAKIKKHKVIEGSIIINNIEVVGYIKRVQEQVTHNGEFFDAPWNYQREIKFIEKSVFDTTEVVRNKMFQSYGPKEIQGYKYDSLIYKSLKFQDLSSLIPEMLFLRESISGAISVYQFYSTPSSISLEENMKPKYEECNKPLYTYVKGDEIKTHGVNEMNVEKDLADCAYVVEKQARGEYKLIGQEGESSGFTKVFNNTVFRLEVRLQAIKDYNANCK